MKGQAIVLKPGETMATAERFAFDKPADLEFLSKAVGGPIEVVPLFDHIQVLAGAGSRRERCVVFCHEEGKLEGLPVNHEAQVLWCFAVDRLITDDYLVGPIVILTGDDDFMDSL